MKKVQLIPNILRPSKMLRRMRAHIGDVSEGSQAKIMAQRIILGKSVTFFENGLRVVNDPDLNEDDEYNSEILRLTHASLLIGQPVGDKRQCWVDASTNPVTVIIYNMLAQDFVKKAKYLMRTGDIDPDFVLNSHLRETEEFTDERNVRLFGRRINQTHLPNRVVY
jgi:hypothetical protein